MIEFKKIYTAEKTRSELAHDIESSFDDMLLKGRGFIIQVSVFGYLYSVYNYRKSNDSTEKKKNFSQ